MDLNTVWNASDLIKTGIAYTVMGILVVFMILIIIMFAIKAMALVSGNGKTQDTNESKKAEAAPAPAAEAAVKKDNDEEIIAVITAAIASMLGESVTGFRVRSYRTVQGDEWNKAGRREILENRL